jgi:hypothetical protein
VSRVAGYGTSWRLLLIAMVAVGVVQMHVFGHPIADHRMPVGAAPAAALAIAGSSASHSDTAMGAGADEAAGSGGPERSIDLLAVCLAILAAAGVVAAVAVLLTRPAGPVLGSAGGLLARCCCGRDPPAPVPPLRRRLADLSVLRI